ncbi:MAG TPA: hypothetical protein VGJ91_15685 [Polyangiaceae bacterium]|jgi:hypothetical protein
MNQTDELSTHRLFAAIVLMGTGLTLGCGGVSEREQPVGPGSAGSGGASLGGSTSTAPDALLGGGGWGASASTIDPGIAGAPPAPVAPGPFACPPQRWSCAQPVCARDNNWALPDDCACDPARPEQASQCAAGKVFVCRNGTFTSDGHPLTQAVPFECSCVDQLSYCAQECSLAYGYTDAGCDSSSGATQVVCGCAVIFLK